MVQLRDDVTLQEVIQHEEASKTEQKRRIIRLLEDYTLKELALHTGRSILWLREQLQ